MGKKIDIQYRNVRLSLYSNEWMKWTREMIISCHELPFAHTRTLDWSYLTADSGWCSLASLEPLHLVTIISPCYIRTLRYSIPPACSPLLSIEFPVVCTSSCTIESLWCCLENILRGGCVALVARDNILLVNLRISQHRSGSQPVAFYKKERAITSYPDS